MGNDVRGPVEPTRGPSLPALVVMGALSVLGAISLVRWAVAVFAWLISFAMLMVVLIGLACWIVVEKRRR